jgi:pSer/pThr/pTyr-binding forkhead associated (FHA) protein
VAKIKFIDLFDRKVSHVIDRTEFLVGRGTDCGLRVADPEVSRHQARVGFKDRQYRIVNLGQTPVRINGQPVASQRLEDGDLMQMGKSRFLIRILDTERPSIALAPGDIPAVYPSGRSSQHRATLILKTAPGHETIYPIAATGVIIGRDEQADIRLTEKNVSRRHCAVETTGGAYTVTRLSRTSSLSVNDHDVDRRVLEDGDRIRLGDHVFIFRYRPDKKATAPPKASPKPMDATQFAPAEDTWQRPPHLLVESVAGDTRVFDLGKERSLIGRDPACDLQLAENTVSRRHARIEKSDGVYRIENLSRSAAVEVNGKPVKRVRLYGGDQILIGTHALVFVSARPEDLRPAKDPAAKNGGAEQPVAAEPAAEHTIFTDAQPIRQLAPRLILDTGTDTARTFLLDQDRMIIGRSSDADIHLDDPSVSRIHGAVETAGDLFFAVSLGTHSPIRVNRVETSRQRIFAGDRIQVGNTALSFMSDRQEDIRPAPSEAATDRRRRFSPMRAALIGLILLLGGYSAYSQIYRPWKAGRFIAEAAAAFGSNRYETGWQIIEMALDEPLSSEKARNARRMLSEATLSQVHRLARTGQEETAQRLLDTYLARHGAEADAALIWREQDRLRLQTAQKRATAGDLSGAMAQYASVRAESPHFPGACKKLSRLWLAAQIDRSTIHRRQTSVAELTALGEKRFAARQYLMPPGQTAYGAFAAILLLAPGQQTAEEKIQAMGNHYSRQGAARMKTDNWPGALESLELAAFIDPANMEILEKMDLCRRKMGQKGKTSVPPGRKSARVTKQAAIEAQALAADKAETMVAALLAAGRAGFESARDLMPFGNNAYGAFQAVLGLAPDNPQATKGIGDVTRRVKNRGEAAFTAEDWPAAESLLGGYLLIDPHDAGVRDKLIVCQKKQAGDKSAPWIAAYLKDS